MTTIKIEVNSKVGLHARPASMFVKQAREYISTIRVKYMDKDVNGKSILEVLSLGAGYGSEIELIAQGSDEKEATEALKNLVENFDE